MLNLEIQETLWHNVLTFYSAKIFFTHRHWDQCVFCRVKQASSGLLRRRKSRSLRNDALYTLLRALCFCREKQSSSRLLCLTLGAEAERKLQLTFNFLCCLLAMDCLSQVCCHQPNFFSANYFLVRYADCCWQHRLRMHYSLWPNHSFY